MIPLHDDNPTTINPVMTITFIVSCVLVFFYQTSLGGQGGQLFVYQFGAIPGVLFGKEALPPEAAVVPASFSLITSMFLHGGFMHLGGNMLYLWIFGNNIEDIMGHGRFVIFYFLCGIIAAMSHAMTDPGSVVPMIGASGAISGVLGAYLLIYPRAHVMVLIPLGFFIKMMYLPAGFVLAFWFLLQIFSGAFSGSQGGGGVAWFAHIGGFIAGIVLVGLFKHKHVHFFNRSPRHRLF